LDLGFCVKAALVLKTCRVELRLDPLPCRLPADAGEQCAHRFTLGGNRAQQFRRGRRVRLGHCCQRIERQQNFVGFGLA
jgi:hypothetical protein